MATLTLHDVPEALLARLEQRARVKVGCSVCRKGAQPQGWCPGDQSRGGGCASPQAGGAAGDERRERPARPVFH